ncbi:argininosuccinate lyase [Alicyclobacillus acidoterrestris]|uniref:Argininosuccinate lyase n=1 Tax=Alicyclobacillus acidoterrestris (strain ATCC 49025 / DSM 3922 / CIP 106132 / NCIMB 13137 / GD3B) TaxID=1356854 RepID=T0BM88_ALIAG|nr:argininosuccinate lyase [Alicyclobacillus acidoterrestris]EPZ41630.1 argininosuccinate lyase [Alicyclobacillus acidoterrestris ATCC 49025]UNO50539.1 argininosuccinate lyase [Alicyclobacillus acidoterrestris]
MKLWGGRFAEDTDELVLKYTASISFDERLWPYDIKGSIAHARMLAQCGIISPAEGRQIIEGLENLAEDIAAGEVTFSLDDEDIHMNIERLLTERIGAVAGKLHTGRSRNDQVALDMHMFVRDAVSTVADAVKELQTALVRQAENHMDVIIPGFTHLQRAQPILLSHHLLAYVWMLERDKSRLSFVADEVDRMPLGAGALAGTTFPIDRKQVANELEFSSLYENSLDAVSDRDYLLDFLFAISTIMTHLSRLSEELILWSTEEFGWIELADEFATGSSMMPQKKNPDVPELVRGKSGRVFGHLMGMFTVLKGLPLAYNKDLQEDKEGVFDAIDTVIPALKLMAGSISTMRIREGRLADALACDFSNATDLADYLVRKGIPFRQAHAIVGQLVQLAILQGTNLNGLDLGTMQAAASVIESDVYELLQPETVVAARQSRGGTAPTAVQLQLALAKEQCGLE